MQLGLIGLGKMGGNMAGGCGWAGTRWWASTSMPTRWQS